MFPVYTKIGCRVAFVGEVTNVTKRQVKVVELKDGNFEEVIVCENNGNGVQFHESIVFMRVPANNKVEFVHFNVAEAKEVKTHQVEVQSRAQKLWLLEDKSGLLKYASADDYLERGLFGWY